MRPDEEALYRALGTAVRRLRLARGLTQDQLAERLELRRTSITNIELGDQGVTAYSLIRLARALGVSPGELLDAALAGTETDLDSLAAGVGHLPLQSWVRSIVAGSGVDASLTEQREPA